MLGSLLICVGLFWIFLELTISNLTGTSMSQYLQQKLLEHTLRHVSWTSPTTVYVALFTVMPGEDGTGGTEVTGGAYARQAATFAAYANTAPTGGKCVTSADISFPVATANWGTIAGVGIYDASSSGNLLLYQTLTANQVINSGQQFVLSAGDLEVDMD